MGATKLLTAAGGGITLDAASTATDKTITIPARTGNMAVDGPAFSAYLGTTQSFSANTWTKATLQSEEFDTAGAYDSTTNYRFQPLVAGYYQFNATLCLSFTGTSSVNGLSLVKNGSNSFDMTVYASTTTGSAINTSKIIYLNGSSDYVELYMYVGGVTGPVLQGPNSVRNFFQAALIRAA